MFVSCKLSDYSESLADGDDSGLALTDVLDAVSSAHAAVKKLRKRAD